MKHLMSKLLVQRFSVAIFMVSRYRMTIREQIRSSLATRVRMGYLERRLTESPLNSRSLLRQFITMLRLYFIQGFTPPKPAAL